MLCFVVFVLNNISSFFYTVEDFVHLCASQRYKGDVVRIGGAVLDIKQVASDTFGCDDSDLCHQILLGDTNNQNLIQSPIKVIFKGIMSPLIRNGQGVVLRGVYNGKYRIFVSQEMLVKHNEVYKKSHNPV